MNEHALIEQSFPRASASCYLDSAAVGLVPSDVVAAVAGCAEALGLGTQGSPLWHEMTDRAPVVVGAEFGVEAEQVEFLASTSDAMNAVARAVPWADRDEIVYFADDFPTVWLPFQRLEASIARVQILPGTEDERTEALIAAISSRTRVVAVSEVHPATGTLVDLERVGRACHAHDALLIVDAAQSAGIGRARRDEVDVYISPGYKWLLAGFGISVVITSDRFAEIARPTLLGYANMPPSRRLHTGHSNLFGLSALVAATEFRQRLGFEAIHDIVIAHAHRLYDGLDARGFSPAAARERTLGIVAIDVADAGNVVVPALKSHGVITAARMGRLRLSPHFYSTDEDIDRFFDAFDSLRTAGTIRSSS